MFALLSGVALMIGSAGFVVAMNSDNENSLQAGGFQEQFALTTHEEQPTMPSSKK
jgi:hypothetical protein